MGLQLSRRAFVSCAAGALAGAIPVSRAGAADAVGRVSEARGAATVLRDGERFALVADSALFLGDRIATGDEARARLLLGRTTQIIMGGAAQLTIDKFLADAGGTIQVGKGAVLIDREPAESAFQVLSPYGLLAVRGTRFFLGPVNGRFSVFVGRGAVEVRAGGRGVLLEAGQGTEIRRRGAPPSAVRAWGPARIAAALAQVE